MIDQDQIRIHGGKPLVGEVEIHGAKNSVPKLIVASLLTDKPCVVNNVCYVADTELMFGVVRAVGGQIESAGERVIRLHTPQMLPLDYKTFKDIAGKSRIPILLCGPLLHRTGQAMIPVLGGDKIGERAVDFHINAICKFGAKCEQKSDGLYFEARKLHGAQIRLEYPSVGATEQVLLTSVLAEGVTELSNAAIEPEIFDLIEALRKMGARITHKPDRIFVVHGVKKLSGFDHTAIPDRLEVASWAAAAVATNGQILTKNTNGQHLEAFIEKYTKLGGGYKVGDEGINFWRAGPLTPLTIETDVYPGFATDWQSPFVVCLTQATGTSLVHETVYENRFGYTDALVSMGANITLSHNCPANPCRFAGIYQHTAEVIGPSKLSGTDIQIPDIRAGFSYVIAALVAEGETTLGNIKILERGYEGFLEKLAQLGAI